MSTPTLFNPFRATQFLAIALTLGTFNEAMAQSPSSLSYPANNAFIANVSNVYLAPNMAGSATGYTISPALPSGLSFNTNTGVITGNPDAASNATNYTITALGGTPAQNTSTITNILVTNNFYNNDYATISFGGTGVTLVNGSTGDTIPSSTTSSVGTNANDVVLYKNVATLSGQSIDCIVKTIAISSGTSFSSYDQNEPTGASWSSNNAKFFSPQVSFPASTASVSGGSLQFNFQFILGGTYVVATKTGTNIVLQKVKINSYDIDGNGSGVNSNQINEFGGFSTSEVGSATTLQAPVFNTTTGLTTYKSNTASNSSVVTADPTRVRIAYDNISDFSIRMGGGGTAYFFLDFSAGPAFTTSDTTFAPSIDLETTKQGVNGNVTGCGTNLSFTQAGQTNISSPSDLTQLMVSFPTAEITNGVNERIIVNGATNGTIPLNTNPNISNLVLGGITYSVVGTTTGSTRTLVFTRSGAFTAANAEALLDALQYNNNATTPSPGSRNFTINLRSTAFQSPNATVTATLNCVAISGNVFHDVNGLVDNTVNATGTAGQFAANGAYVLRVNPANNQVIDVQPIDANGAFNFGTVTPGTYNFYVSNVTQSAGTVINAATFPAGGYVASGENLGAAAGNDHANDGKMVITIGSQSVTNANFGLQIPPTTTPNTINNIANPGGYNGYTILPGTFLTGDVDGTVDSIRINSFPTGANYIKIGNTVYTNGGNCPPQVTTCTPWPGTVSVPFSAGNPTPAISVDPSAEGNTAAVINFTAWDNGRATSNASNLTLNFIGSTSFNVSGNVWNDANGNGLQAAGENLIAPADASQAFYAVLIQQNHTYSGTGTILNAMVVSSSTGYNFANVPAGNDYSVQIMSLASAPVPGAAASTISPHFAPNWIAVSTNTNGTIVNNLNTTNPSISLPNLTGSISNVNFGLERLPDATNVLVSVSIPSIGTLYTLNGVGTNLPVPPATDAEDGIMGAGKSIVISTLPQYTTLRYNGIPATLGQTIPNFNPTLLQVEITTATLAQSGTSFTFNYLDAAGKPDPTPATYGITWGVNLSVEMGAFTAVKENGNVNLNWITYSEVNNNGFDIEHSLDGRIWKGIGFVASAAQDGNSNEKLSYTFSHNSPANSVNYYRLKQTDKDNKFAYSEIRKVIFAEGNTISIYPNPATSTINVKTADWSKVDEVIVMDVNGKVLLRNADASQGMFIGTLTNGNYILQVKQTNGDVSNFKVVKQ